MITKEKFEEYCSKNNLRYKFNYKHYAERELLKNWNNNILFIVLCQYGYLETLKWILTIEKINIHINDEEAFRMSCKNKNLELAQWLIDNKTIYKVNCFVSKIIWRFAPNDFDISKENGNIIDIHVNDEEAFFCSCCIGNLEVAKWLIEISKENEEKINIHINNEEVFRFSCHNVKIAKWLLEISKENGEIINIHANDEEAFIKSCINGQRNNLQSKLFRFQHYFARSAK